MQKSRRATRPDDHRISQWAATLDVKYYSKKGRKIPTDLVVESMGLKIYGRGRVENAYARNAKTQNLAQACAIEWVGYDNGQYTSQ